MKNRKKFFSCSLFVIFTLLLGFNNCDRPISFRQDGASVDLLRSHDIIVGNPLASKTLVANICSLLSACHPQVSLTACEAGIFNTTGIESQLGIPKGAMKTYSEIIQAETDGLLRADSKAVSSCTSEIQKLTCSDPLVQQAFTSSASDPFAGVAFMIPTTPGSCQAVFSQPPARTEYFVSTTGSDLNDGSVNKPWATINHAAQSLALGTEGTTVHVAPGNYYPPTSPSCIAGQNNSNSCGIQTDRSGTAAAPIIYISDHRWGAKIIPIDAYSAWYNSGDYVSIIGFEVIGNATTNIGIQSEGSFVRVESNQIHDIPVSLGCLHGIGGGGISHSNPLAHDNDSIGNVIHNIGPFPGNGQPFSSYCNHAHGIHYHQPGGHIHNNLIYRIASWGVCSWSNASNLKITNNLIFNNGSSDDTGLLIGGAIVLAAATGSTHDYTTVSNNIIRNNSGKGIHNQMNTGTHNIFINNVLYANGSNFNFKPGTVDVGSINSDPLMINFTMDGTGDYRLQTGSPAKEAGTTACATGSGCTPDKDYLGFLRPYGSAIDIGPYEWHP